MNPYEQAHRLERVRRLDAALDAFVETYPEERFQVLNLAGWTPAMRAALAALAGITPPSDETWALLLEHRAQVRELVARALHEEGEPDPAEYCYRCDRPATLHAPDCPARPEPALR